ncbi:MAG: GNAT family N-acetyltransferase [Candidatus Thorarchaeota archaeon]
MARAITAEEISKLDLLIRNYVTHKKEVGVTPDTVKRQMKSGITKETHQVLCEENSAGVAQGFLVINLNADRLPIIFADWNFEIERILLDHAFNKLSKTCSHISFESGYPTPWISEDLSSYATTIGFVKHAQAYMQLQPINKDIFAKVSIGEEFEFIPFTNAMVEEISKLVFKCVDGTIDQDLFPFAYGTIQKIEEFLHKFLSGSFGSHEPLYSWILKEDTRNIGACFLFTMEKTGFLMHIVIDPEFRRQGLGNALFCHSLQSLLRVNPSVTKIELAVTLSNPAKLMYDSLGFRILNDSSTYVWKR